ncbi:MAG: high affinity sulfate transporter 1 [Clostridiales bacterium]|nr:high affinity sulfate transporter 1 [Clostridiales bacterium]
MFLPKLFTCLKNYSKEQFIKDFTAGIIVAVIAFPLAIALAIASGVSPEKGLHTAIIGGFIISFLGGSRVQIGGPTGAFIVIVFGIVQNYGLNGLIISTLIAGFFLLLMGFLRMGSMIKYIPYPITTGFTSGIAITIFSTQVKDFLGLTMDKVPSEFLPKWIAYFKSMPTINYYSLIIGLLSLIIILLWPKINKKIPGTLIAILVATILTSILKLPINTIGSQFGTISSSLPKFVVPELDFTIIKELLLPGLTIAVLAGVESLLSAVVADGMIGSKHRSNMELVAQGTANIFSALFGGIPVTGAIARTAANIKNGGRTPVSGIVHSVALLVIMMVFLPYMKLVPMSSLAAILIVVSYNMGEWEVFKMIRKAPKSDAAIFLVTFCLTIFIDLVFAITIGVVLASFLFMRRMADVAEVKSILDSDEGEETSELLASSPTEDISFYEISGPFFFGAADKFINVIREMNFSSKVLILKMSHVPAMDSTAYHGIEMLYDMCKKNSTKLIFSELQPQPQKVLEKYGFIDHVGSENFCDNLDAAVERANLFISENHNISSTKVSNSI